MKRRFTILTAALALLVSLAIPMGMWGQTTYNFANIPTTGWSTSGGSQTINNISWTYSSSTYIGNQSGRIQVGSSKKPQTTAWTIQTPISSFASDATVTAVSITAYTTASTATYDISVGGSSVKSGSLTTSSATYSATNLNFTSGSIVVTMTGSSSSKAMYLNNISVTYTTGSGTQTVATPTFSPASGTYTGTQTVSISCTTENSTIYYTTNGDDPTTSSSVYSAPLTISETTTVKAMAVADGYNNSSIATASYTIKCATPTFSPAAGTYTEAQTVTISCATQGATIYYTTDGTTPTTESAVYNSALTISETTQVKAMAAKSGLSNSNVAYAEYTINLPYTGADYVRITDINSLTDGARVIIAARYNTTATSYYAMTAATSGKPTGVSFTSTTSSNGEILPSSIVNSESTYYWTVNVTSNGYTFTNAGNKVLGYNSSTNFAEGGDNTEWTIVRNTSGSAAMVANYQGFYITNKNNSGRGIALNNQHNYGPYATSNNNSSDYNFYLDFFVQGYTSASVATPTFSPAEGTYYQIQNVTISCETQGATIYYTTDGTNPTNASTQYTGAITVAETTTIKAIAYDGTDYSAVATATYIIDLPLSTMDQIFAKATEVGNTATTVRIAFNNWIVTGANNSSHTFVSDGTKGFMIYQSNHGFSAGDVLSGIVECKVQLYNGAAEITQLTSSTSGLTVTTGGTVTVADIAMADLTGINTGALVSYRNLTCEARVEGNYTNYYLSDGTTEIQAYKTLLNDYADYLEDGKTYNITGVFVLNNGTKRVNPRNAADIEGVYTLSIPAFYGQNGGYRLIASPIGTVKPENVTNMLTQKDGDNNTYDLYRFDQAEELEWQNYRYNNFANAFDLTVGHGYLYGNLSDVELVFTGTAITSGTQNVTLDYTEGAEFAGWNLVGNPFGVEAYIDRPFYRMNTSGQINGTTETGSIGVMEGVFVIATNEEQMPFSTQPIVKKGSTLALNLNSSHTVLDRAIVRFDEGQQLPKFQLNKNHTKVYFTMDGKDYAIVRSEEMGAMPVNFKAEDNGTYSLNFSCENVEFSYLHLIDNLTGKDIDLLQTPSYSFEARTTDYASRFKLVYATGDNSDSDTFAFFSNGSFVINNEGNATLQVIDVTGRIIKSESINGSANVNVNAAPGVYMLRLVNGDNVKVQKVVVK